MLNGIPAHAPQDGFLGKRCGWALWELVSLSADGIVWFGGLGALCMLPTESKWSPGAHALEMFAIGMVVDLAVIVALKQTFRRKRPVYHRPDFRFVGPDKYSFPSGHSTRAWLVSALLFSTKAGDVWSGALGRASLAWAACVSVGRVALGRHYVTDIVCGAFVSLVCTVPLTQLAHPLVFGA